MAGFRFVSGQGRQDAFPPVFGSAEDGLLPVDAAAGGSNTVTPTSGTITLTGYAPKLQTSLTPSSGTVTLTGYAPTVTVATVVTPTSGSIVLTGYAPELRTSLAPASSDLVLTGYAPNVTVANVVTPTSGELVITGYAPSLTETLTPASGELTLTGYAPSLDQALTPDSGQLTLTGYAPSLTTTITPDSGTLVLTGFAPNVGGVVTVEPDSATLIITGYAPTVTVTDNATQTYGGAGWSAYYLPRRTQKEIDEERYRLGIIPRPAAAAVRKVAKKIVKQAKEAEVDPLEYLRETHARQRAFLESELRAREQTARLAYMQVLMLEIELMVQAQEDEDIINLLFEM